MCASAWPGGSTARRAARDVAGGAEPAREPRPGPGADGRAPPRCAGAGEAAEENAPEPRFETSAVRGEKASKQNEEVTVDLRLILPHAVDAVSVEVAAVPRARQRDE